MYLYFFIPFKINNYLITFLFVFYLYFNIFYRLIIINNIMRIIITKRGNAIIQELDNSQRQSVNSSLNLKFGQTIGTVSRNSVSVSYFNPKKNLRKNNRKGVLTNIGEPVKQRKSSLIFRNSKYSSQNKTSNEFTTSINIDDKSSLSVKKIRQIKIAKKKSYYFPKTFIDKYENASTDTNTTNLLPTLNNIKGISNNQTNGLNSINEKYLTFNEIIPDQTIRDMKKKILNLNEEKNKNTKITSNNFRTEYVPESDLQKFNKILSYPKININETNLIKYINEKTKEPSQVKLMFESNNEKLNKMNKACQMSFINDEKDKLFNALIKNKIRNKASDNKKMFLKKINTIENDIKEGNKKLQKYNKKISQREKYYEIFNDFVYDFWSKKNFERFNKKSTPKPKYLNNKLNHLYEN